MRIEPMPEAKDFDVAVVGAGIAGCTAATLLGRAGARVALIEQRPDAASYKTMCTHFIQAGATPTIQRLGLTEPIETAGGIRNGVEMWTGQGWIRPQLGADFPYPRYGYDITREKLDPMLRELAGGTPGVELLLDHRVTGLIDAGGRPAGVHTVDRDARTHAVGARVVVAADGRYSSVARMARVPARVKPNDRFVYFAYYRDLPLVSDHRTLFWFLDPDVAYLFPQGGDVALAAVFLTKDQLPWFERDVERNLVGYFDGLPNAPDVAAAHRISKIFGKLDVPDIIRPAGRPGLALVGDAAMAPDPLWGVGCGFAFQTAEWLADELAPVLAGGASDELIDAAIDRYRKRHRWQLRVHYVTTSDYSSGRRFTPAERLMMTAAANDARTSAWFYAFGSRSIRPTGAEAMKLVGHIARVALTHRKPAPVEQPSGAHSEGRPLPAGVESGRLTVDGLTVPVSSAGPPDAEEAVVFVHGNPGSRRDWDDLLSQAGRHARAVALDMPGFGRADKPDDFEYTVAGYARFLEAALDELGVRRAHLVLHDFGGPWGLEWAVREPERLASAVLITTGALLDYRWHYLARIWRTPLAGEAFVGATTRSGFRTVLRHGNPRGLPRAFVDRMYDDLDAGTKRAILRLYRATDDPAGMGRRQADALAPLDRPALVVWGAHDPYLPTSLAAKQREAFPSAEVAILEESGHWPFADDPVACGAVVQPFLRRVTGGDRVAVTA